MQRRKGSDWNHLGERQGVEETEKIVPTAAAAAAIFAGVGGGGGGGGDSV